MLRIAQVTLKKRKNSSVENKKWVYIVIFHTLCFVSYLKSLTKFNNTKNS